MKCHDAEELIVQLVYDELTGEARDDLLKHLESCGGCRETFNDLKESSVILSDSFSDLDELKLTDEELVEILSVTPEGEEAMSSSNAVADQEKTRAKRPFYFNSTFGIAATLLVTSCVLVVIYWSKMFGRSYKDIAVAEKSIMNAPISASELSGPVDYELVEEIEMDEMSDGKDAVYLQRKPLGGRKSISKEAASDNVWANGISVDGHVRADKLASSSLSVTAGEETSPVDVSDDAPTTNDNIEVMDVLGNGSSFTYSITTDRDHNGPGKGLLALKPGHANLESGAAVKTDNQGRVDDFQAIDRTGKSDGTIVIGGDNYFIADSSGAKDNSAPAKPKVPAPTTVTSADKRQLMEGYLAKKWNVGKERNEEAKQERITVAKKSKKKKLADGALLYSLKNSGTTLGENAPVVEKERKAREDIARGLVDAGPEDKSPKEINQIEIIHRRQLKSQELAKKDTPLQKGEKEEVGKVVDTELLARQKEVFKKQKQWTRSRDSYESVLLRDPANKEAIDGLKNIYAELREAAQKRRKASESERMSEIEWKWIDSIPAKDFEKAMQDEDPFANELVAKNGKGDDVDPDLANVKLPHFVDEKVETLAEIEKMNKQEPMRESFFKPIPVNPFVMTSEDALSTFALDTDTAAYGIARNYINQGYLPPAGSVRTEEYVNAFDYNYPRNNANTFTVQAEAAPSPFGKGLVMLKVGVRGKVIGRDGRKASHLVFAVDTSGSMERQDRMPLLKQGLNTLLDNLDARDSISLIAYGRESQLILDNTPMTQAEDIRKAINDLQCGGSTNLHEGIQLAYRVARQNFRSGGVNSVILCSDGMANIGDQTAESMVNTADTYRKQGISFNSVGFGMGNYNDNILETMANKGDGSYVFIDSAKEAVSFFTEELGNRLNVIARDAKIQVKFDPHRVRRYRLLGYENRDIADKDFRNDSVDAGEVGSGQSATAIYEVELLDDADARDLGTVFIRYQNTTTNKVEEINSRLRGDMVRERTPSDSPRFFLAAAVTEFAEILRESEYAKDGSMEAVQRIAEQVAVQLPLDDKVQEFRYLVNKAKGLPRAK